jgi:hypothetical protein
MNSILSCFCNCLPSSLSLLKLSRKEIEGRQINNNNNSKDNLKNRLILVKAFKQLLSVYWSGRYTMINPIKFRNQVLAVTNSFPAYEQHDAHVCSLF